MPRGTGSRKRNPRRKPAAATAEPEATAPETLEQNASEKIKQAGQTEAPPEGVFRYRVLRRCTWGKRMWDPDTHEIVKIDVGRAGVPPHHFKALDGGPQNYPSPGSRWAREAHRGLRDQDDVFEGPASMAEAYGIKGKPLGQPRQGITSNDWAPDDGPVDEDATGKEFDATDQ